MTPYQIYLLWQIERPKTTAEQRAADARLGMLAAAVSRSTRQAARTTARSRQGVARAVRSAGARAAARVAS
jgi:hypothetical protein